MKSGLVSFAAFAGIVILGSAALAAPLTVTSGSPGIPGVEQAQHGQSREFRRCMRRTYGPHYFARVPRAHRWHMSQACMR